MSLDPALLPAVTLDGGGGEGHESVVLILGRLSLNSVKVCIYKYTAGHPMKIYPVYTMHTSNPSTLGVQPKSDNRQSLSQLIRRKDNHWSL
jgi:hypothetical protein